MILSVFCVGTRNPRSLQTNSASVMVENLFRGQPPGERPLPRNPFFIRVSAKSVVPTAVFGINRQGLTWTRYKCEPVSALVVVKYIGLPVA